MQQLPPTNLTPPLLPVLQIAMASFPDPTASSPTPPTFAGSRLADLRKSYERAELDESASHANPFDQFQQWLQEAMAAQVPEPNAMTLATVDAEGRPSTRVVLIKGVDGPDGPVGQRGLVWYTNYHSRKGRELAGNPLAALQFHWVELERVVRIQGRVQLATTEESDAYYRSRPLDSRIGAWASPQSEVISNRATLVANAAKFAAKFVLNPPRPPHWGGYRLVPDGFEFWQGRKSRLHDRLRYRLDADRDENAPGLAWVRERLAP
jgi:pyridoxamine 5'-phosphate oxidase